MKRLLKYISFILSKKSKLIIVFNKDNHGLTYSFMSDLKSGCVTETRLDLGRVLEAVFININEKLDEDEALELIDKILKN